MNEDFKIMDLDKNRLDEEWVNQDKLTRKACDQLAEAKAEVRDLDAAFDLTKAEVSNNLRSNPQDYGLEKTTDEVIKQATIMQPDYQKALRLLNKAKKKVDFIESKVKQAEHRKPALENLVYLWGAGYFASPREPINTEGAMNKKMRNQALTKKRRNDDS